MKTEAANSDSMREIYDVVVLGKSRKQPAQDLAKKLTAHEKADCGLEKRESERLRAKRVNQIPRAA